ncbi:DUF4180 domain-containing protein [Chromobacterium aquaticum]|uniref:DUF4180 domain-containing protein n=1 Tax=Chromobacterium aquaticum TaxID=467180 RepID=A0ABV9A159_9NEIS|nr:DUF4180 domain-containing protein [Chromobacterium aquaticum]MCD5361100.1 DUF4180 domain-containing protein [Chromobacterium aquaticum]
MSKPAPRPLQAELLTIQQTGLIECRAGVQRLEQALELVALCGEHDAPRLLLLEDALPADFFELSSRFAGEFIQKLVNYRIAVAGVFADGNAHGERFGEYLREARHGRQFRVFDEREAALTWLAAQH